MRRGTGNFAEKCFVDRISGQVVTSGVPRSLSGDANCGGRWHFVRFARKSSFDRSGPYATHQKL